MMAHLMAGALLALGCSVSPEQTAEKGGSVAPASSPAAMPQRGEPKSPVPPPPGGEGARRRPAPDDPAGAPPTGDGERRRSAGDGDSGSGRARRMAEALSAEELEEVIAVAAEISPEWGAGLRERLATDPEGLRKAVVNAGPRLLGLTMLKRSHPELFALRVEDLRIQNELKSLVSEYRSRVEAGDASAAAIEAKLREKVQRQVDLDLRASAMELQALDEQLKRLVEQLKAETLQRSERVERALAEIKAGNEPKPMVRPWIGGERGMRGMRRPPPPSREQNGSAERAPTPPPPPPPPPGAPGAR